MMSLKILEWLEVGETEGHRPSGLVGSRSSTVGTKEMINKQVPSLAFTTNNGATSLPSSNVKQLRLVTQATFQSIHLLKLGG